MRSQSGLSLWGLLAVGILMTLGALLTMKIAPPYFDNLKLKEGLETLAEEPEFPTWNRTTIIRKLDNMLYIDFAHDIVDLKQALKVQKTKAHMQVSLDYERVVPLVYNVSALLDFNNQVEVPLRQ
ncbi:MAG: DUF4845 domain-containing protein [Gammaproteobacteria bacterium]|nr:DUF4845 domain-containing protein [Gammaproteobacteria bacterium]